MKNYSKKTNKRLTRYRSPSPFRIKKNFVVGKYKDLSRKNKYKGK